MNEKDLKIALETIIFKSYPISRLNIILDCAKTEEKREKNF
jgi:hypothetical protein